MLNKVLNLCKEHKIENDVPVGQLAKSLTDLSNANWNFFFDTEFNSIMFELSKTDRSLSFVQDPKQNKVIFFKQVGAKVTSGFNPTSANLEELIKWLEGR
jgi:hypothetical protein